MITLHLLKLMGFLFCFLRGEGLTNNPLQNMVQKENALYLRFQILKAKNLEIHYEYIPCVLTIILIK